ncbi:hypothetical protein H0H92_004955 [Tricholoma furcatifolium]|nr:hypothetical protein H0H92_004955 [Tricholoma furcatifolium]
MVMDSDSSERDDDHESTPKMTSTTTLMGPLETPADRLRALLAMTPKPASMSQLPPSTYDNASDFDPPNALSESTISSARDSLKDLFSRARRDPGNTPQKEAVRRRRNSIDISEVEASPRVEQQRAQNKSNRKTLSDEEVDPARSSEASFRSQATTFDILRERLNFQSQIQDVGLADSINQYSVPDEDDEDDREDDEVSNFLQSEPDTSMPLAGTSTPQQTLHMSMDSHLPSQSKDLLDQDSEMQRLFEGSDGYATEESAQRPGMMKQPY